MRFLRTTELLPKETCSFTAFLGVDGLGAPSYDTPLDFEANILEYGGVQGGAQKYIVAPDGTQRAVAVTLYVKGDEANVPGPQDRVELSSESRPFVVLEVKPVSGLWYTSGEPDHYEVSLGLEGA